MTLDQARALRVGQRIRFDTGKRFNEQVTDPPTTGRITDKQGDVVRIKWEEVDGRRVAITPTDGSNVRICADSAEWWANIHAL